MKRNSSKSGNNRDLLTRLLRHKWIIVVILVLVGICMLAVFLSPSVTTVSNSKPSKKSSEQPTQPEKSSREKAASGTSTETRKKSTAVGVSSPPPVVAVQVIARSPHDTNAFTQGLLVHQGQLWEGTGLYGRSQVRKLEWGTGNVIKSFDLPRQDFGEGLTIFDNQLIQLTWQNHIGYVYDLNSFPSKPVQTFKYQMEGWGLTHTSEELILSDGSSTLYFLEPKTYSIKRKLTVRWFNNGRLEPVRMLNELEYIRGVIYANVWMTDLILLIDPTSGIVKKVIDCKAIHPSPGNREMTLNGIAWDEQQQKLFITGKLWPMLFEIEFVGVEPEETASSD